MATGLASAVANSLLSAIFKATNYTAPVAVYAKLHVGDPGAAGTANPAGETARQSVSFGAASGGSIASNADTVWTSVSTAETYSYVSYWDAASGGNFLGSEALTTARTVAVGDDFTLPSGQLTASFTPIAA